MPHDDLLEAALRAHVVDSLASHAPLEAIRSVISTLMDSHLPDVQDKEVATDARGIASGRHVGVRCTVMATICEISQPEQVVVGSNGTLRYIRVTARDGSGDTIPCLPVVDDALGKKLLEAGRRGVPVRLRGAPVSLPRLTTRPPSWGIDSCARDNALILTAVDTEYSHLDAMAATDDERTLAEQKISKSKGRGLFLLTQVLNEDLHLAGTTNSPIHELLSWITLQALGCGRQGHSPGHLHILIVGPPGIGKKLLPLAAGKLNPVMEDLTPVRISIPGLVGPLERGPQGWTMGTGSLGRATGGVTSMQDAHAWREAQVRQLAPVLQHIMEDGEVRVGGMAGGQTRSANTSLLIDANRTTDTLGRGRMAPILDNVPLLTRFDLIFELPTDLKGSWDAGAAMLTATNLAPSSEPRLLKAIIATLRDRHPVVNLTTISSALESGYRAVEEENAEFLENYPALAGSIPRRLSISMRRIASAAARAGDRSDANDEDAKLAIRAARAKLEFLARHVVRMSACPSTAPDVGSWLRGKGGVVNPDELAVEYKTETGNSVSSRTIRRALVDLGCPREGKGLYRLGAPAKEAE